MNWRDPIIVIAGLYLAWRFILVVRTEIEILHTPPEDDSIR